MIYFKTTVYRTKEHCLELFNQIITNDQKVFLHMNRNR